MKKNLKIALWVAAGSAAGHLLHAWRTGAPLQADLLLIKFFLGLAVGYLVCWALDKRRLHE